jgi:hypothetical protein
MSLFREHLALDMLGLVLSFDSVIARSVAILAPLSYPGVSVTQEIARMEDVEGV